MEVIEENKAGYKKTQLGWIPNEWNITNINIISDYKKSNFNDGDWIESIHIIEEGIRIIQTGNIGIGKFIDKKKKKFISEDSFTELKCNEVFEGDILICRLADPSGRACRLPKLDDYKAVTSVDVSIFRPMNSIADPNYLVHFFSTRNWLNEVKKRCAGSTRSRIPRSELGKIKFYLPPLPEQQNIASILSDWDKVIETTHNLIDKLKLRKKGLMQKLFKGELRLVDESIYPTWKINNLNYYLEYSNFKNEDNRYSKQDVLSVSGEFGIVNQIDFQGRSFAGKSVANYGIVNKGDIVYTKSPLKANPYGIIKVNRGSAGIVSTLYAVYKCKDTACGDFIDYFFQLDDNLNSYLRPLVQKGTKNDMKINNQKVLSGKVKFPSKEEQIQIASFLRTIDNEIQITKKKLDYIQLQKKGLMQQLLTGKIRVNQN